MYGIEWDQPAIIAQGLAQAAIHENYVGTFFAKVETEAAGISSDASFATLPEAFEQVQSDDKFVMSVRNGDPNKILDGVEILCPEEGIPYLSRIKVDKDNLEEAAAENVHASAYMAATSVFHPPHVPRYDFFLM